MATPEDLAQSLNQHRDGSPAKSCGCAHTEILALRHRAWNFRRQTPKIHRIHQRTKILRPRFDTGKQETRFREGKRGILHQARRDNRSGPLARTLRTPAQGSERPVKKPLHDPGIPAPLHLFEIQWETLRSDAVKAGQTWTDKIPERGTSPIVYRDVLQAVFAHPAQGRRGAEHEVRVLLKCGSDNHIAAAGTGKPHLPHALHRQIRDGDTMVPDRRDLNPEHRGPGRLDGAGSQKSCLLYTSDAADE